MLKVNFLLFIQTEKLYELIPFSKLFLHKAICLALKKKFGILTHCGCFKIEVNWRRWCMEVKLKECLIQKRQITLLDTQYAVEGHIQGVTLNLSLAGGGVSYLRLRKVYCTIQQTPSREQGYSPKKEVLSPTHSNVQDGFNCPSASLQIILAFIEQLFTDTSIYVQHLYIHNPSVDVRFTGRRIAWKKKEWGWHLRIHQVRLWYLNSMIHSQYIWAYEKQWDQTFRSLHCRYLRINIHPNNFSADKIKDLLQHRDCTSNSEGKFRLHCQQLFIQDLKNKLGCRCYEAHIQEKYLSIKNLHLISKHGIFAKLDQLYVSTKDPNQTVHLKLFQLNLSKASTQFLVGFCSLGSVFKDTEEAAHTDSKCENNHLNDIIENYLPSHKSTSEPHCLYVENCNLPEVRFLEKNFTIEGDYLEYSGLIKDLVSPQKIICKCAIILLPQTQGTYPAHRFIAKVKLRRILLRFLSNGDWAFSIYRGYLRDFTESYWDYAFHQVDPDTPLLSLTSIKHQVGNVASQSLNLFVSDIALNIDELLIHKIAPEIKTRVLIVNNILECFSTQIGYFTDCRVNSLETFVSYKPRGVHLGKLMDGETQQLLRLGTTRDVKLTFPAVDIAYAYGMGDFVNQIGDRWLNTVANKGLFIFSQVGILRHILAPLFRTEKIVQSKGKGGLKSRVVGYAKEMANDTLEVATRATVALGSTIEQLQGSKKSFSKFADAPTDFYQGLEKASHHFKKGKLTQGITTTLLGIQNSLNPAQAIRMRKRYKHHTHPPSTVNNLEDDEWVMEF